MIWDAVGVVWLGAEGYGLTPTVDIEATHNAIPQLP